MRLRHQWRVRAAILVRKRAAAYQRKRQELLTPKVGARFSPTPLLPIAEHVADIYRRRSQASPRTSTHTRAHVHGRRHRYLRRVRGARWWCTRENMRGWCPRNFTERGTAAMGSARRVGKWGDRHTQRGWTKGIDGLGTLAGFGLGRWGLTQSKYALRARLLGVRVRRRLLGAQRAAEAATPGFCDRWRLVYALQVAVRAWRVRHGEG